LLLAELGHRVVGTDWSPVMIARAEEKCAAAGMPARFFVMDAAEPSFAPGQFDVVLCRHLLWALPNPAQVLRHWARLLAPHGRLILIEGFWHTGGGLHVGELLASLPPRMDEFGTVNLNAHPALWGGQVDDERYLIAARRRPSRL
jgi:SAM-dependent methyltransferase